MSSNHPRNVTAMRDSPRCGAKTRRGTLCQCPAVGGAGRCRMHGGAKGSGAQAGNSNALKHGLHTKENKIVRQANRELIMLVKKTIRELP